VTRAEILAFISGVRTALKAARGAAQALRAESGWKPTREGAIDALDEFAAAGEALLIELPRAPSLAAALGPQLPKTHQMPHPRLSMANSNRQRAPAAGNELANGHVELNSIGGQRPQILIPYDRREAISLRKAAEISGRSQTTVRAWCGKFLIGRRIVGGPWEVSRVALDMLLAGDEKALRTYLAGNRSGPLVTPYFARAGLRPDRQANASPKLSKLGC
jgi:hypothetical protein